MMHQWPDLWLYIDAFIFIEEKNFEKEEKQKQQKQLINK